MCILVYSLRAIENIQYVPLLIRVPLIQTATIPPEIYMHNMMQYKTTNLKKTSSGYVNIS